MLVGFATIASLAGCGFLSREQLDNWSITYRVNIQQGMVVTQEMAAMLKPGMTRDQVRFVLGTPILTDPFHAERWDYPFRFQPGRGTIEERRFTVYFDKDVFARYEADPLPTEEEFAASRHFATTKIAKAPLQPAPTSPGAPGSTAPNAGGATSTTSNVSVPVRRPQGTQSTTSAPPPGSGTPATDGSDSGTTPR